MAGLVYTAIFGKYDTPKPIKHPEKGVDYIMFTDGKGAPGWDVRKREVMTTAREESRYRKVMVPQVYDDHDWYLWIDGSMEIQAPIKDLMAEVLEKRRFAAFEHPEWKCAYTEIQKCAERHKDSSRKLAQAAALLEASKFPRNFGQLATGVLARANCDLVRNHAAMWWSSMQASTMRDQCTFMLNLWKLESYIRWIPGDYRKNKWFKYHRGHR